MDTRSKNQELIRSTYFLLPNRNYSDFRDDKAYAARVWEEIDKQISLHDSSGLEEEPSEKQLELARDLVVFCKKIDHFLAWRILGEAARHANFTDSTAHQIILTAIDEENFYRSPINTDEKTLKFIKDFHTTHQQEVDDFLRKPEWLLAWIEQASALEISRFFTYYFDPTLDDYFNGIKSLADDELRQKKNGAAVILFSLMHRGSLQGDKHVLPAITATDFKREQFPRVIASANVRMYESVESIKQASGCFINCYKLTMPGENFNNLHLDGAWLNHADLHGATFINTSLCGTQLHTTSLINADLTSANLQGANLTHAFLNSAKLIQADLRFAKLIHADLSGANLYKAELREADFSGAILDNVIFFERGIYKFPEEVAEELTRLHLMLKNHASHTALKKAILANFLDDMSSPAIPESVKIRIMRVAYYHPFFAEHEVYAIPNAVFNNIATPIYGFFYRHIMNQPAEEELCQASATDEQKAIRKLYTKYRIDDGSSAELRPLPPNYPPPKPDETQVTLSNLN